METPAKDSLIVYLAPTGSINKQEAQLTDEFFRQKDVGKNGRT